MNTHLRRLRPAWLAVLVFCAALTNACTNDIKQDDSNFDLSTPDFYNPPDISSGNTGTYGSGSSGSSGGDMFQDMGPDVPVIPCDEVAFEYTGAASSVWITGSFNDWATSPTEGAIELSEDSPGVWSTTAVFPMGDYGQHFYKLIIDGDQWVSDPNALSSSPDHFGGNYSVLEVCEPLPAQPCGTVQFVYDDPGATSVWVSGSLTAWGTNPSEGALEMDDSSGVWRLTTTVEPGDHQYKFIVDGSEWLPDPSNPNSIDDGFGSVNSVLTVACESSCGDVTAFDWRDAVLYFAMVDRFNDSDNSSSPVPGATGDIGSGASGQYEGGDLAGVTAQMSYLADLGVTALWLSAPYENRDSAGAAIDPSSDSNMYSAYHGYWPSPANTDYSGATPSPLPEIEQRISASGDGDAELRALIDAAHGADSANGHGIKILFDYVMNHVDSESGLYQAHPEWFARDNGSIKLCASDCGGQSCWDDSYWTTRCAFTDYLPPFDFYNPTARAWSVNDAIWWAKSYGIDGYRLDAIKHVPLDWLTELRGRLNQEFPMPDGDRFYLVGETYDWGNRGLLKSFVDPTTMLDGQFDFPFRKELCEATMGSGNLGGFSDWLKGNDAFYGPGALMSTWIGNHDIPRVIHNATGQFGCTQGSYAAIGWSFDYNQPSDAAPYEKLRVAFALMLTNPGLPLIYYGDEIGLAGGGDPDNRRMMVWDDGQLNSHQIALRSSVRELARIRGENKAITRGRRSTVSVSNDTWVYRMGGCGVDAPDVIVAVNRAGNANSVDIPAGSYVNLSNNASQQGGSTSLPPRSYLILRVE